MSSDDDSTRVNKYLALHTGLSRRQADELLSRGRVTINGEKAIIGARVTTGDRVEVDGKLLKAHTALQYVALHKPAGYVCSRRAQGNNPTIYSLLPKEFHTLKPVGRLDKDSSGLLLLTNDGHFALRMTHPRYYKIKRYEVTLDRPLEPLHQQMVSDFGVELEDGKSRITLERRSDDRKNWTVIMSEGRNRQIRRTFASLGYTVIRLHRTDFGSYTIGTLKAGQSQIVDRL